MAPTFGCLIELIECVYSLLIGLIDSALSGFNSQFFGIFFLNSIIVACLNLALRLKRCHVHVVDVPCTVKLNGIN